MLLVRNTDDFLLAFYLDERHPRLLMTLFQHGNPQFCSASSGLQHDGKDKLGEKYSTRQVHTPLWLPPCFSSSSLHFIVFSKFIEAS